MRSFDQLQSAFETHRNPERATQMAAYMRDQFVFYGIQTPVRTRLCRDVFKAAKREGVIDWGFVDSCWADAHREFQYVACDYLNALHDQLHFDDVPRLFTYVKTKQWWDTIDRLDRIIGDIGLRDDRIDALMRTWSTDDDFWVRRIAIDHQLLRKDRTNTELLETILVNNVGSSEFFINKAIGWALRDYSKTNPDWVRSFINRHHAQLATLSIREGSKYL